ncbi:aminoacyl-tRNA hydrolase [Corynebacterium poyangense]|uniref:Peptidyl-tRNA hydrolase n=1 Tax=Corynebacterium poyangense TaxID=2684405 RepID=A0A7H0SMY8_9CORY|nr:aminoacyl-tRNA hydrolase [Corynebacterium poyangense]QNQ89913.1 aminoacyl-tRNA hydrolase [Corynebacterium poyangense]
MRHRSLLTSILAAIGLRPRENAPTPGNASEPNLDLSDISAQWLIVGLGNPGADYAATRHNVGYMAVDDLLADNGDILTRISNVPAHGALVQWGDTPVMILRPTTYMNNSGDAIAPVADALGISPDQIVVLHDELDLAPGKIRLRYGGNENGHNGLKSTSQALGTRDYLRVRIGIGRPDPGTSVVDHVLGPVDTGPDFDALISTAAEAARLIVQQGLVQAQNQIHSK